MAAVPLATKPKVVEALAPRLPFQDSLRTLTEEPEPDWRPPHSWLMDCEPGQLQVTVQPLIAELPARTVTLDWNPPVQEFTVWIVAVHPPDAGGGVNEGDEEGEGLGDWGFVGDGEVGPLPSGAMARPVVGEIMPA
ncbi:hypothetical protein SAMN05421833_1724, partial [Microbispora rosea]